MMDILNSVFMFIGAILVWLNVLKIFQDKQIRGISIRVQIFFSAWGWWNIIYFFSLHQFISVFVGIILTLGNTAWCILALKYKNR